MKVFIFVCYLIGIAIAFPSNLVPNTPENIARLSVEKPEGNAEELSGQFEGDIILNNQQSDILAGNIPRTGLIDTRYRWINNTVAYILDGVFSTAQRAHILNGLAELERISCLRFVPYTDEEDYIEVIGTDTGCWSEVGRQGGKQNLNLQLYEPEAGCFRLGTIMHEFIHAIGFYHMQSATERDEYVTIMWENITPGMEHNFNTYPDTVITNFNVPYDYDSVMHYGAYGFSVNGERTIVTLDPLAEIGQRERLSEHDIERINAMYCAE